jgi:hypothetical protein
VVIGVRLRVLFLVVCLTLAGERSQATPFGNEQGWAEFPQGTISFADEVADYAPNIQGGQPIPGNRGAFNALGRPNATLDDVCDVATECDSVSLGDGGSLTLRFVDNALIGSDSPAMDLWIFEVGPDVEDTFVELSADGQSWVSVGKVYGSTSGIDLDAFGFGSSNAFFYVRLTDDGDEGNQVGVAVGADIDAVGASSTIPIVPKVPEPASAALLALGAAMLAATRRSPRRAE